MNENIEEPVVYINAGHLAEAINDLEDLEPKDKRSKIWKEWKNKLNLLMKEYNERFGKMYIMK